MVYMPDIKSSVLGEWCLYYNNNNNIIIMIIMMLRAD